MREGKRAPLNFPEEEPAKGRPGKGKGKEKGKDAPCYICSGIGHWARDCPEQARGTLCYKCNEYGRIAKDRPKGG